MMPRLGLIALFARRDLSLAFLLAGLAWLGLITHLMTNHWQLAELCSCSRLY